MKIAQRHREKLEPWLEDILDDLRRKNMVRYAILIVLSIALLVCMLSTGCISITNHVTVAAPADPANPAIAEMERAAPTNALASRANGTVAISSAIYSHKVISPDTTATLAK